jgi:hypothetical protein
MKGQYLFTTLAASLLWLPALHADESAIPSIEALG